MGVVALEVIGGELGCGGVPGGVVDGLVLMGEVPWEVIGGVLGCGGVPGGGVGGLVLMDAVALEVIGQIGVPSEGLREGIKLKTLEVDDSDDTAVAELNTVERESEYIKL